MLIPPQSFMVYGINQDSKVKVNFDDTFFLVINSHLIITNFYFSPLVKFGVNTHDPASNVITSV